MNERQLKSVLIVALDNLGDTVMATAITRPLRIRVPGVKIGIWTKKYSAGLFEDEALVDHVHGSDPFWDTAPGLPAGDWETFSKEWKSVRSLRYEAAFLLNTEWRRSLACLMAGIPVRVGYRRRKSGAFLTHEVRPPSEILSRVDEHRFLVEGYFGGPFSGETWVPRLDLTAAERDWGERWVEGIGWRNHPIMALHPFSGDRLKNWPMKNWLELIQGVTTRNPSIRFCFVCSPQEQSALLDEIRHLNQDLVRVVSSGCLQLKGALARSVLFVGGDSGPGHVAAALGKPTLSLFGPTDPRIYMPSGCADHSAIHRDPITDIPVNEVLERAMALMEAIFRRSTTLDRS